MGTEKTAIERACQILERLPDDVDWQTIIYEFRRCHGIEQGIADSKAGRVKSVAEVRKGFGLDEDT